MLAILWTVWWQENCETFLGEASPVYDSVHMLNKTLRFLLTSAAVAPKLGADSHLNHKVCQDLYPDRLPIKAILTCRPRSS